MADSEIIENVISAQHCRHDAVAELVQVKCAAHRTWRAFVFYCYTGQLSVEDLKKWSFDAVKAGLSKHNIVEEALSYFTSRHPDIQAMELEILMQNRNEPEVQQALETKLTQMLATGRSPHSATALNALIRLLSNVGV
ncbi:hypothetical protein BU15DRAFT_84426 [Melanogaster broomeanus]|nr:hypothetical protein BU15DRAFT_84426 [Melanogaster broomeanus]